MPFFISITLQMRGRVPTASTGEHQKEKRTHTHTQILSRSNRVQYGSYNSRKFVHDIQALEQIQ